MTTISRGCLNEIGFEAPRAFGGLGTVDHSIDADCHEKFELCAMRESVDKLVDYISAAQRWIAAAQIQCSESSERNEHADEP